MAPLAEAVTVSLAELKIGTVPFETLRQAFGPDSLGILVVKDVPPEFPELRHRALSYASYLGNLPKHTLDALENPEAKYLTGWSRGRETLRNGQVDTLKGSFYSNCAFYADPSPERARAADPARYGEESFPEYLSPNVWPADADLPGMRPAIEALCRLVIDAAVLVARACDRFAEREIPGYERGYLERVVGTSSTTKARLLHYFPRDDDEGSLDEDDWCATHADHGCLTGLTSAMFIDEAVAVPVVPGEARANGALPPALEELSASPDPEAGLYIHSRTGETVQVRIPRGCIAFQTGEALERITRGRFKAVPHFVRGVRPGVGAGGRVARNTLAVFTQPNLEEVVDAEQGLTFGEFARGVVAKNTVV